MILRGKPHGTRSDALCPRQNASQVVDSMEERRFQSGDAVIEEGGPGDFFYVTGSGELEVRVRCLPHEYFAFRNPQHFTLLSS